MIKILICGIGGKMGGKVCEVLKDDRSAKVVCGVETKASGEITVPVYADFENVREEVDAVIDFSSPAALAGELEWAKKKHVPLVLAATGYNEEQLRQIGECAKEVAIFKTANFSLGVNLLVELVNEAARTLGEEFDIEIVEKHHRLKADAPSGTAKMLAESANKAFGGQKKCLYGREGIVGARGTEIGVHAVRGGTIVGEHEVIFAGEDEILTLSHSAQSKKVFAKGAVAAAKWVAGMPAGLYDMKDMLCKKDESN